MPRTPEAIVDSKLRLEGKILPDNVVEEIIEGLTIENPEKVEAEKNELHGWEKLQDEIDMWEVDGDFLVMPRGFAFDLAEILDHHGIEVEWEDRRTQPRGFRIGNEIPLRPEQNKIITAILEAEQGIAQSPTGSGKTVAGLGVIRETPGKAIVIVNTKEIAAQWISRAKQWLGEDFPVSMIGDGKFEVSSRLTIAIQGTLWSRRKQLREEGFFEQFVVAILDECHHVTAATYNEIVEEFTSLIRIGFSATPEKTGEFALAEAALGPIIVEITEEELGDSIVKPEVIVIQTKFGVKSTGKKKSKKPAAAWARRRDYQTLLKNLVIDKDRNRLIATEIMTNHRSNANLVLSKRINHMESLWDVLVGLGYPEDRMLAMVGAHSIEERQRAIDLTEEGECILFTTLADEALDAPRLDRCHLIFPTRNPDLVKQQIGRVRRRHPDKTDALVIDYRDMQVEAFESQYMTRRHEVYNVLGFKVTKRPVGSPHG